MSFFSSFCHPQTLHLISFGNCRKLNFPFSRACRLDRYCSTGFNLFHYSRIPRLLFQATQRNQLPHMVAQLKQSAIKSRMRAKKALRCLPTCRLRLLLRLQNIVFLTWVMRVQNAEQRWKSRLLSGAGQYIDALALWWHQTMFGHFFYQAMA